MARNYRHGSCSIGASDGFRLIGGFSLPSFSSPLHIFVSSSSADDKCELVVFGINEQGVRDSENIRVAGQDRVFSTNKYVFVEAILVVGSVPNIGDLSFHTENGQNLGTMVAGICQLTKASYPYTLSGTVSAYGVSAKGNAPGEPIEVRLTVDRKGLQRAIHTCFVKTDGSSFQKDFGDAVPARIGDIVSVYAKTDSADVTVAAWLETQETQTQ